MHFYQKRWFGITAFVSKAPKVQEVVKLMATGPLHSLENIINYTCGIYESDSTRIRAVMDQGVKQGTDFALYFYQIRWFSFTTFASNASRQQEAVRKTASCTPLSVHKYYKLYIQQISEWSRPCVECEARFWFLHTFLLNTNVWHYRVCLQALNLQEAVNITASAPLMLRRKNINYTYC